MVVNAPLHNKTELRQTIRSIPSLPGCYIMKDYNDRFLYIGKSKNLRSRVSSYFRDNNDNSPRISLMIRQVNDIEIILTDTEDEALVLESNLIKDNQPYFNILLKDDKKYPYLCITWSEDYPRIYITRRRRMRNKLDKYYGPYVDVGLLRRTLDLVKKAFPLRQRPTPLYKDRTCLNYSIGRCPGVCQKMIAPEDYHQIIKKVEMVFQGRCEDLIQLLKDQMKSYSNRMDYESAALTRDQIQGLNQLTQEQKMTIPDSSVSLDVIASASVDNLSSIQIFKMRAGKLVGRIAYTDDLSNINHDYVLQRVIEEHYSQLDSVEIPKEILVEDKLPQHDLINQWLTELRGRKVNLKQPIRSQKLQLIDLVKRNATYELTRTQKGLEKNILALEDLAELLQLLYLPKRIEGYDISHIQGSDAVGSQVVFANGLPAKQHYRKYKIKDNVIKSGHSDDYLALGEVIRRRFRKWANLKKEIGNIQEYKRRKQSLFDRQLFDDWPDLVLIDGGKGQLSSVINVFKELDLSEDINVCSLAKRKEEIFIPGQLKPLNSDPDQAGVLLLRRIRDESHRFAISFHREQRSKRMKRSTLSDIPGLGSKRIRDLLDHFRSIEAIQIASISELSQVKGFGESIATEVHNYFNPEE